VVTIDAMGWMPAGDRREDRCQTGRLHLAVKENQDHLLEKIKDSFQVLAADSVGEEVDYGDGRVKQRTHSPG
jgi:predicted transposase YbfD/YdcC